MAFLIRNMLIDILNTCPAYFEDMKWKAMYSDMKHGLQIIGIIEQSNFLYNQIVVELKLNSPNIEPSGFHLARQTENWTIVDISEAEHNGVSIYQRNGKWIEFIKNLHKDILERRRNFEKMNDIPVDDDKLFPDGA